MVGARCYRAVTEMPVNDTHKCRASGVLQRREAEEEEMIAWKEGVRCYEALTGIPVSAPTIDVRRAGGML